SKPVGELANHICRTRRHEEQVDTVGDGDVLDVGVGAPTELRREHGPPRERLEGQRPDETRRRARHHGDDIVAALLQPAADLDGLVGADPAGDAERDEAHSTGSSTFSTLRRNTSRWAIVAFFSPASRGTAPASSW